MLRANHTAEGCCYFDVPHRKWIAMSLLSSAYRIFVDTSRIRKLDALAELDFGRERSLHQSLRLSRLLWSFDPAVLDAIRIATCFENVFKARLLLRGYVIHRVDRSGIPQAHASLAKAQHVCPVRIADIKRAEGLTRRRDNGYVFKSLSVHTIDWQTIVRQSAYRSALILPDRLFEALEDIIAKRNSLHFLANDVSHYNQQVVDDLLFIRASFNRYVVIAHNRLVRALGVPDVHLRKQLVGSPTKRKRV